MKRRAALEKARRRESTLPIAGNYPNKDFAGGGGGGGSIFVDFSNISRRENANEVLVYWGSFYEARG